MTQDPTKRRLRDWAGELTLPQAWALGIAIVVLLGGTFKLGYWFGGRGCPNVPRIDCTYTSVRVAGRSWPPPGKTMLVDTFPTDWPITPNAAGSRHERSAAELAESSGRLKPARGLAAAEPER